MRLNFSFLLILILGWGVSTSQAQIVPPSGLQPGDQYRLIAPGIAVTHYQYSDPYRSYRFREANVKAQIWADSSLVGQLGATWQAVITYSDWSDPIKVSAKDHTRSNPDIDGVGVPIYQTNGTRVAANYADLWDGTLETPIRYGGNGQYVPDSNMYINNGGTYEPTGKTAQWFTGSGGWWSPTAGGPCYAMSSILTVPGGAPVNTAPTVSCPEATQFECGPASHDVTLSVDLTDEDGDALNVEWSVDGVSQQSHEVTGPTDSFTFTYGMGVSEVTVTVDDGTAAPVSCSTVVTVVDTTEPVAICSDDVVVDTDEGECFATNVSLGTPMVSDNCGDVTSENNAPDSFPLGTTTVVWTFTDASGNSVTCEQLVTVEDHEAPYVPMLDEIVVPHESGVCDASVSLGTPEATDNCGVASVTNDAPENGRFLVGDTVVTWTVTDTSGNMATTTQMVTVTNTDPVADVRVTGADIADEYNKIYIECDGAEGTLVALDASASYDPDQGDTLSYSWAAADSSGVTFSDDSATPSATFPMGSTSVTLVVTDQCGAVSSTDVIVVIEDTIAPQIEIIYGDKQMLWPPNHKMVPVAVNLAVRDTCSNPEQLLISCIAQSNQPDDSEGDGSTTGDVDGVDGYANNVEVAMSWNETSQQWEGLIELRAERDGGNQDRKYSFHCVVADSSGNMTEATFCVVVPHDKRK